MIGHGTAQEFVVAARGPLALWTLLEYDLESMLRMPWIWLIVPCSVAQQCPVYKPWCITITLFPTEAALVQ